MHDPTEIRPSFFHGRSASIKIQVIISNLSYGQYILLLLEEEEHKVNVNTHTDKRRMTANVSNKAHGDSQ